MALKRVWQMVPCHWLKLPMVSVVCICGICMGRMKSNLMVPIHYQIMFIQNWIGMQCYQHISYEPWYQHVYIMTLVSIIMPPLMMLIDFM
jgi:hypothetical protein